MFNSGIVLNHYFCSDIPANEQYVARMLNRFPEAGPVQNVSERFSVCSFDVTQRTFTARDATLSYVCVCVCVCVCVLTACVISVIWH